MSVLTGLGAPVADIALEVPLSDEFFDLILECDAFFGVVANILMVPAILVLASFLVVSPHCVRSFVDSRSLCGQEYILARPRRVRKVVVFAQRGSDDPLI